MAQSQQKSTTQSKANKKKSPEFDDFDLEQVTKELAESFVHNLNENALNDAPEYPGQPGYPKRSKPVKQ